MNLTGVKEGDIVMCDVRGDRFYAFAGELLEGRQRSAGIAPLAVAPLGLRPIPAHRVTSRQVVGHWRKSKQSKV